MDITIHTPTGSAYSVHLPLSSNVGALKKTIQREAGIPVALQKISIPRRKLSDRFPIAELKKGINLKLVLTRGDITGSHTFVTENGHVFSGDRSDIFITKEQAYEECMKRVNILMNKSENPDKVHLMNSRQVVLYSCDGYLTTYDILDPEAGCEQIESKIQWVCHCGGTLDKEFKGLCICNCCGNYVGKNFKADSMWMMEKREDNIIAEAR